MKKRASAVKDARDQHELRRALHRSVATLCDEEGNVSRDIAQHFVAEMAYWIRSDEEIVAAPGHARRLTGTTKTWYIEFGASRLHVSELLCRAVGTIKRWMFHETDITNPSAIGVLRAYLAIDVQASVTDRRGIRTRRYGGDDLRLVFGTQELRVDRFIDLLGRFLGFPQLDSDLPRRMALLVKCPQCGQQVKHRHLDVHMRDRCRKRLPPPTHVSR